MIKADPKGLHLGPQIIPWPELTSVGIRTTADGPLAEDVFWVFVGGFGHLELPGGAIAGELVGQLHDYLPGLDSMKIIAAMGSTDERIFRVWHKDARGPWSDDTYRDRFAALIERLGGAPEPARDCFDRLRAAWDQAARAYHNLEHLADCLWEIDNVTPPSDIAELALWYHDAIYEPGQRDCEERSARWLLEDATALGISEGAAESAAAAIRATAHHMDDVPQAPVTQLVLDIDLAILGRDALRFMEYEHGIEEEYAPIAGAGFFVGRGRFLKSVLDAPVIYRTETFRERYEAKARDNIERLLRSPRYRTHRWFGRLISAFR